MAAKSRRAPQSRQTTLRHLWLAGLGLAAVVRRQATALPQRVLGGAWPGKDERCRRQPREGAGHRGGD
jgi:hypothetical protein